MIIQIELKPRTHPIGFRDAPSASFVMLGMAVNAGIVDITQQTIGEVSFEVRLLWRESSCRGDVLLQRLHRRLLDT